jgi:hypothetical protein
MLVTRSRSRTTVGYRSVRDELESDPGTQSVSHGEVGNVVGAAFIAQADSGSKGCEQALHQQDRSLFDKSVKEELMGRHRPACRSTRGLRRCRVAAADHPAAGVRTVPDPAASDRMASLCEGVCVVPRRARRYYSLTNTDKFTLSKVVSAAFFPAWFQQSGIHQLAQISRRGGLSDLVG